MAQMGWLPGNQHGSPSPCPSLCEDGPETRASLREGDGAGQTVTGIPEGHRTSGRLVRGQGHLNRKRSPAASGANWPVQRKLLCLSQGPAQPQLRRTPSQGDGQAGGPPASEDPALSLPLSNPTGWESPNQPHAVLDGRLKRTGDSRTKAASLHADQRSRWLQAGAWAMRHLPGGHPAPPRRPSRTGCHRAGCPFGWQQPRHPP